MATKKRNIIPEGYYHIYNRAAYKRTIFRHSKDYYRFVDRILNYKLLTKVKLLAYSILPNHYHLLLKEPDLKEKENLKFNGSCQTSISQFMHRLDGAYTKYYQYHAQHSGVVFQGKFKSKHVDDDKYLDELIYYINLNSLKHQIVDNINDWEYTSHHDYLYNKQGIIDHDFLIDFDDYKLDLDSYVKNYKKLEKKLDKYLF